MTTHTVPLAGIARTFDADFRLATRPYALSRTAAGPERIQAATLYHGTASTKKVRISVVQVAVESSSAVAIITADLVKLTSATTPATGNPAVTPTPRDPGDPAAEVTCLALPTTPGTEGALVSMVEWNLGITGAAPTTNPVPGLQFVDLYRVDNQPRLKPLLLRNGQAEGVAVVFDASAAVTYKAFVVVTFTEDDSAGLN
jgi:hypothetical protein